VRVAGVPAMREWIEDAKLEPEEVLTHGKPVGQNKY